jgi:hypothetical protein
LKKNLSEKRRQATHCNTTQCANEMCFVGRERGKDEKKQRGHVL